MVDIGFRIATTHRHRTSDTHYHTAHAVRSRNKFFMTNTRRSKSWPLKKTDFEFFFPVTVPVPDACASIWHIYRPSSSVHVQIQSNWERKQHKWKWNWENRREKLAKLDRYWWPNCQWAKINKCEYWTVPINISNLRSSLCHYFEWQRIGWVGAIIIIILAFGRSWFTAFTIYPMRRMVNEHAKIAKIAKSPSPSTLYTICAIFDGRESDIPISPIVFTA